MVRLGLITGFIALIGVLLSGLAAYRVHDQELTVEGIALARAIDVNASLVQDRLTERELLARVASGLFRSPSVVKANVLQPLRSSIYAFKTDFVLAGWVARLRPDELEAARAQLASAGFPNPTIRSFDDVPLDAAAITGPVEILMDVEPRSDQTKDLVGRSLGQHPILGPMLMQAMTEMKSVASNPMPLLRPDGPAQRDLRDGRVCGWKTEVIRLHLDGRLALESLEKIRIAFLDRVPPADRIAVVADVLAVGGPVRGDRGRVTVVERLDLLLDQFVDGLLVGLAIRAPGRLALDSQVADAEEDQGQCGD